MTGEAERYNFIRDKLGLSKKDFGDSLGLSTSMNSQVSTGRVRLPRELIGRLFELYNVNLTWFLTGQGLSGLDDAPEADCAQIELYDLEAAAGQGREVEEHAEKRSVPVPLDFIRPHNPASIKAVYVTGDSMAGERINDGDIVLFNVRQTEGSGVFVLSIGTALVVKRVDFDHANRAIVLISANPAYEPRRYSGADLEEVRIVGRVVACYHRM